MYWLAIMGSALVAVSATLDAQVTSQTRPEQLYVTQTMLAIALAVFFSASCLLGFGPVIREGNVHIVSFLAAFTFAQFMGSLIGSAWVGSFVYARQQFHLQILAQHLRIGDPLVEARIRTYGAAVKDLVGERIEQTHQGLTLLARAVQREALVLAYVDLFNAIAAIGVGMLVWFICLHIRSRRTQAAGAPATPAAAVTAS